MMLRIIFFVRKNCDANFLKNNCENFRRFFC